MKYISLDNLSEFYEEFNKEQNARFIVDVGEEYCYLEIHMTTDQVVRLAFKGKTPTNYEELYNMELYLEKCYAYIDGQTWEALYPTDWGKGVDFGTYERGTVFVAKIEQDNINNIFVDYYSDSAFTGQWKNKGGVKHITNGDELLELIDYRIEKWINDKK